MEARIFRCEILFTQSRFFQNSISLIWLQRTSKNQKRKRVDCQSATDNQDTDAEIKYKERSVECITFTECC